MPKNKGSYIFNYAEYARNLRQEIHSYPEVGFDLPKTLPDTAVPLHNVCFDVDEGRLEYGISTFVNFVWIIRAMLNCKADKK